jgi:hypothetical protein
MDTVRNTTNGRGAEPLYEIFGVSNRATEAGHRRAHNFLWKPEGRDKYGRTKHSTRRSITAWTRPRCIHPQPAFNLKLVLSSYLRSSLPDGLLPFIFSDQIFVHISHFPNWAACPAHLMHLGFIILTTYCEEHKLCSCSLCISSCKYSKPSSNAVSIIRGVLKRCSKIRELLLRFKRLNMER